MSSVQLLDKTRKIGKLLHNNNSSKVVFDDICNILGDILDSNTLVISKKGKILGVGHKDKALNLGDMMIETIIRTILFYFLARKMPRAMRGWGLVMCFGRHCDLFVSYVF